MCLAFVITRSEANPSIWRLSTRVLSSEKLPHRLNGRTFHPTLIVNTILHRSVESLCSILLEPTNILGLFTNWKLSLSRNRWQFTRLDRSWSSVHILYISCTAFNELKVYRFGSICWVSLWTFLSCYCCFHFQALVCIFVPFSVKVSTALKHLDLCHRSLSTPIKQVVACA